MAQWKETRVDHPKAPDRQNGSREWRAQYLTVQSISTDPLSLLEGVPVGKLNKEVDKYVLIVMIHSFYPSLDYLTQLGLRVNLGLTPFVFHISYT